MVLMMACELTFSTPAERGTFPNCRLWGWGSYGPLGAATRSPRRRRPFRFFFRGSAWFLAQTRVLGFRTDDGRNRAPPPFLRTENRQNFIAIFFGDFNKLRALFSISSWLFFNKRLALFK